MKKASQVYKKIKNIPTSQAIDALSREWFNRKPPVGIRKEKAEVVFIKHAGELDPIMPTMAADVWENENKLRPEIRKAILDNLYSYAPKESVKQVVLLGAITGYQYGSDPEDRATADLDVNAVLDPPSLVEELWEIRRAHNDKPIAGTRHPLNIYLQKMGEIIPAYQDSYYGVYDVLADKWLVKPPPRSKYRNPEAEYWAELVSIRMLANQLVRLVDNYNQSIEDRQKIKPPITQQDAWNIIKLDNRISRDLKEIISFINNLQEGRDLVYNVGWGVPRAGYLNLLYKYIHGFLPSRYENTLAEVEEIIHKSKYSNVSTKV